MSILTSILGIDGIGAAATAVTSSVTEVIKRFVPDPEKQMEFQQAMASTLTQSMATQMDAMARVMEADSKSDSALTRNARPLLVYWALGFITLIVGFAAFADVAPVLAALNAVPDKLWDICTYGVGIFAAGRSAEKITEKVASAISKKVK